MLIINIEDSEILKKAYDDGYDACIAKNLISKKLIAKVYSILEGEQLEINDAQKQYITTFSPDRLMDILILSGNHEKLLEMVTPKIEDGDSSN